MTEDLAAFWIHPIGVERYAGSGAYGDTFAASTTGTGFVDDTRKLVRNAAGQEIVASASVFLPASTPAVPLDSRVTLPALFGDKVARVVAVARHDGGTLGLPDHIELHLL